MNPQRSSDATCYDALRSANGVQIAKTTNRGQTHKSLKGNNFATPPRTMNTATAKFTMRLHTLISKTLKSYCLRFQQNSQDIGKVHGGRIGEMWEPQLDDVEVKGVRE
jgi:hypothetical protein